MSYQINALVEQIGHTHFEGNITPIEWFQHIRFENGRPDTNAILLLSDIVYWYRPSIVRDESSGRVITYKKKFKADLLQRSYCDYEDLFGFSKKQIRDCFIRLESLELIRRVFRTIETSSGPQSNVMFIQVNPTRIQEITHKLPPSNLKVTSFFPQSNHLLTLKERGHNLEGKTYTETTSEITTEINTHQARASESTISQSFSELENLKTQSKFPCESLTNLSLDEELSFEGKSFLTPQNVIQPFLQPTFPTPAFPQHADLKSMVAMWNGIVRKSASPVELNPERMPILAKRLIESFGSKLSVWQQYCRQIAKSSFLMGQGERGWKVTLDWALEPLNISKVLEGNYSSSADPALEAQVSLLPTIDLTAVHPRWSRVCKYLIEAIGLPKFNSWIGSLIPEGLDTSKPILKAPTSFTKDWVERHYLEIIKEAFKQIDPRIEEVSIIHIQGKAI
jgi:hypothetical protein